MTQAGAGSGWRDKARGTLVVTGENRRSSPSPRFSRRSTSSGFRTRCACCSRTSCATATTPTSRRSRRGIRRPSPRARSPFGPGASSSRTSPAFPPIVDLAAMRDAMLDRGGDPAQGQPAHPGRARHRPLRPGGRVRDAARDPHERRARLRAQRRALRVPALGPGAPSTTSRSSPPNTGICHQVNLEYLARVVDAARRDRLPRHARRHRLAHDDGQRARRARLGRRRHRGRGGAARRARLDARPAGRRLPAHRLAARGRDRDRPRPDGHRDPARARRRREVRRVLRRPASSSSPWPTARRSRTCRPSTARPAGSSPWTTRRSTTCAMTGRSKEQIELVEAYCREQGLYHEPERLADVLAGRGARPRRRRARASPGRAARRTACRSPASRDSFEAALEQFGDPVRERLARQGERRLVPRERPAGRHRSGEQEHVEEPAAAVALAEPVAPAHVQVTLDDGQTITLEHGAVVIAAITSCTNTSNPSVMIAAGLRREEGGRAGPRAQAVGEVEPRARLQGRDRVLRARRPAALPRRARLPDGRLRLHDLHRELRAAARADLEGRRSTTTSSSPPSSPGTGTSRRASTRR